MWGVHRHWVLGRYHPWECARFEAIIASRGEGLQVLLDRVRCRCEWALMPLHCPSLTDARNSLAYKRKISSKHVTLWRYVDAFRPKPRLMPRVPTLWSCSTLNSAPLSNTTTRKPTNTALSSNPAPNHSRRTLCLWCSE